MMRGLLGRCAVAVATCLAAGALGAGGAHAGFVPALGSPFAYDPPAQGFAVADADGNGTLDVVAGAPTLRHGAGTGFLGGQYPVGPFGGPAASAVVAADLDLDGRTDYAALLPATPGSRLVRYLAQPAGGYAAEELIGPDDGLGAAAHLAVAPIDADGLPDLVALGDTPGAQVTVVYGAPGRDPATFPSGIAQPTGVAAADLDLDGRVDVVAAGADPAQVRVLANTGDGELAAAVVQPPGPTDGALLDIAVGDLDRDGYPDLVAADLGGFALRVARGDRAGGFLAPQFYGSGFLGTASALAIGDVDGDGLADVLAGGEGAVTLHLGDGAGGLRHDPTWTRNAGGAYAAMLGQVEIADLNRDGQPDAVTANGEGSLSVLLNDQTGVLVADPGVVDFGPVLPASGSRTAHVTLRSTRGALRITRLEKNGSPLFAVSDVSCVGRLLLRGEACSVAVRFDAPRKAARHEALLSFDVNAPAVVVAIGATTRPPQFLGQRLKRKRVRPGQRLLLRYRLSEGALVRGTVERALSGRRVAGECVAARRGNLRRKRCVRWVEVGVPVRTRALGGLNQLKVATRARPTGRGRKRRAGAVFPPGAYRLTLTAADRFNNQSLERRLRFRVVEPPARRRR